MAPDVPQLPIVERCIGEVIVLDVMGQMTVDAGTHDLSAHVRRCLDEGHRGVLLNLRDVAHCDTGGIAALVTSVTLVDGRGGVLMLVGVQPSVLGLLKEMGLLAECLRMKRLRWLSLRRRLNRKTVP